MLCKRCQAELPDGQRFCPACGALQPMICPSCGAESRAGSRACSSCGKKLPMAERENKLVYVGRKRHRGAAIATVSITLGALLLLGGAASYLFSTLKEIGSEEQVLLEQQVETPPATDDPEILPEETVPEEVPETPAPEEEPPAETSQPEETEPEETEPEEAEPDTDLAESEPENTRQEWIFPDSSERLLTAADLEGLSAWELKVARNEIYARHGRIFTSADLKSHFSACSWYEGTIAPENFLDTMLSATEQANVTFLKAAE